MCITGTGIAFLVFLYTDYWHSAALMEWIVTYLGSFWIGTFAGYIRYANRLQQLLLLTSFTYLYLPTVSVKLVAWRSARSNPNNVPFWHLYRHDIRTLKMARL